jgi:hypothetical protein
MTYGGGGELQHYAILTSILDTLIGQLYMSAALTISTQPLLPVDWERG